MEGLLLVAMAAAEPKAFRAPVGNAAWVAEYGGGASLAGWRADGWGLALEVGPQAGTLGGSLGWRHLHPDGWGLDVTPGVGLVIPLVEPGLGLSLSPAARVGWRRKGFEIGLGLSIPVTVGFFGGGPGLAVRVPLLVEPGVGLGVGSLRLGLTGSMGPVWVTETLPGIAVSGRIAIGWVR